MEKKQVQDYKITIDNPSQLVLEVEELSQLRRKLPSQHETLKAREEAILKRLGERTIDTFRGILMFELDMNHVCDMVNEQFADGISLEEDTIDYPYTRSVRRKPTILEAPTKTKELSAKKGISIHVGKHQIMGDNTFVVNHLSIPTLALEDTFEESHKRR